jgi:hypothetical protein
MASATMCASLEASPVLDLPMYGIILAICLASSGSLVALWWMVGAKLMQDVMPCGIAYVAPIAWPILWLRPTPPV